ncbi:hypothetical protein FOL47_000677, partial [Perkinsus chesapeaki]
AAAQVSPIGVQMHFHNHLFAQDIDVKFHYPAAADSILSGEIGRSRLKSEMKNLATIMAKQSAALKRVLYEKNSFASFRADEKDELSTAEAVTDFVMRHEIDASDLSCTRDYNMLCNRLLRILPESGNLIVSFYVPPVGPKDWADQGDGEHCRAPYYYSGSCSEIVRFGGLGPLGKGRLARHCDARYPCTDECNQNFDLPCPEAWNQLGDGNCQAPTDYSGNCPPVYDLRDHSRVMKYRFAELCDVAWPCFA